MWALDIAERSGTSSGNISRPVLQQQCGRDERRRVRDQKAFVPRLISDVGVRVNSRRFHSSCACTNQGGSREEEVGREVYGTLQHRGFQIAQVELRNSGQRGRQ